MSKRRKQFVEIIQDGKALPIAPDDAQAMMRAQFDRSQLLAVILFDPLLGRTAVQIIDPAVVDDVVAVLRDAANQFEQSQKGQ